MGVSHYPEEGLTLDALLTQADKAMYREKAASDTRGKPRRTRNGVFVRNSDVAP